MREKNSILNEAATRLDGLPADYGDGWATGNAKDLVRIMIAFGGCSMELAKRVALAGTPGRKVNTATVERILAGMNNEVTA